MKTPKPNAILCGTDFSENADKAAAVADALARRLGAPCILAHSVDERGEFPDNIRARLMNDDRPRLAEQAERLRALGLVFEEKLLRGVPDEGVASFAAQTGARLVVVGVSIMGSERAGRWVLGNIAERIAESSPVPTLVVQDAAPFVAWARGERTLKVFVAADFSHASDAAIAWIKELRRIGPCEVNVGYADRPTAEGERLGIYAPSPFAANPPQLQKRLEHDLREKVSALLGDGDARIRVAACGEDPAARLLELVKAVGADLLLVGTHQRHGLGRIGHSSVSRELLRHAPMSVACVPVAAIELESGRLPEIRRVLVATDFSELGDRAVLHACSLLREGGTVFLVHVTHPMSMPNPLSMDLGSKVDKALEEHTARVREASVRLRALIPTGPERRCIASEAATVGHGEPEGPPHAGAFHGIACEAHVIESTDPAKAICQAAERFGADVICLGSHGRSGLSALLMGSVAQAVTTRSHRPVFVVRPPLP